MTKNFQRHEFSCKCGCGLDNISLGLVVMLQDARDALGGAIKINSGVRCPSHNKAVGGSVTSSHVPKDIGLGIEYGHAVDIKVHNSAHRFRLVNALLDSGFRRIGIGKDFIHVDIDLDKAQDVIFDYYDKD